MISDQHRSTRLTQYLVTFALGAETSPYQIEYSHNQSD